MKRDIGKSVYMTNDAIENYGKKWRGVKLVITRVATKYMPAKEFYAQGKPSGYHPCYDNALSGMPLYDLKRDDNGEDLQFSLYDWEVKS